MGGKTHIAFQPILQKCCKTSCTFLLPVFKYLKRTIGHIWEKKYLDEEGLSQGGRECPRLRLAIWSLATFIGNNRKIESKELPSCSISWLLIAYTQQFVILATALPLIDCEQSLFFFKQTLKSRFTCLVCQHFSSDAKKSLDRERPFSLALRVVSLFSFLSRLAPSITRVGICVSRVLLDRLQKKERLLVV